MSKPRVCVLRAPGTNSDVETAHAFDLSGAAAERVHLFRVLENPALLADFQVLCVPGGFSYGDDIGAGVIFSRHLSGQLADAVGTFLQADKLVLGICNGFQVLLKAGILPGGAAQWPPQSEPDATLTWNANGKYTAVWVRLKAASRQCVFTRGMDGVELPIAHAEGRIVVRDPATVDTWRAAGQLALCYAPREETPDVPGVDALLEYPHNPNGSAANIAGLCDPTGRVLGLMPHPERFIHATQHPQWTRRRLTGEGQGLRLFRNAVEYFTA